MTGMSSAHCYVHDHQSKYLSHQMNQETLIFSLSFISFSFFIASLIFAFIDAIILG